MSDINPVLDRQAHGVGGSGFSLFHHHDSAAQHHEKAAEQHRRAAEAHRAGDAGGAASFATQAWGHGAHAQHHANESLKGYADPSDIVVGASPGTTGGFAGAPIASDGVSAGYPTEPSVGGATTLNPDAAYTPNIGGAPGQHS